MIFTIEADNNISRFRSAKEAKAAMSGDYEQFGSAKELSGAASKWPATRLIDIWNSLPGQKPVKKFTDRKAAVKRIWTAIQSLAHDAAAQAAPVAPKKAKSGKPASEKAKAPPSRSGSKSAQVLNLLKQPGGATLKQIMSATNWQAHSVRGFISGTLGKKMGLTVASDKREDGERVYSIAQ